MIKRSYYKVVYLLNPDGIGHFPNILKVFSIDYCHINTTQIYYIRWIWENVLAKFQET